ncbi:hypothetical protein FHL15_010000 [Xylaria flabelliformis]|uniref:Formate dehydrogenase n=1 Tax=Xylaria flabelliformis TaxID=2512241 RepID=A0A553HMA2_9PEZI|nr:hypothetical protein FHL15_010000 [Xylaria flabelliformis]
MHNKMPPGHVRGQQARQARQVWVRYNDTTVQRSGMPPHKAATITNLADTEPSPSPGRRGAEGAAPQDPNAPMQLQSLYHTRRQCNSKRRFARLHALSACLLLPLSSVPRKPFIDLPDAGPNLLTTRIATYLPALPLRSPAAACLGIVAFYPSVVLAPSALARPVASLRGLTSRAASASKSHTSALFSPPPTGAPASTRLLTTRREKVKVLAVLYDGGEHAKQQPDLLGTTENELGIRKWLEDQGHTLVTTSDKEGENSTFDKELVDAEIIITTPFHPGYLTAERLAKAKNLKLAVTAGIGSDHVDLNAANTTNGGIIVAEVTGSNVVSVAEHVVMTILVLVRNFVPAHEQIQAGEWDVAAAAKNEYDLENKVVGTVAVGRIGERVLRRLKAFDCKELLYFDYQPLKPEIEKEIGCRRVDTLEEMLAQCDVVTINCPLHEKTRGLFNKDLIAKMKPGSWLVNTARGAIVVKEDVAEALKSGHLRGYGGDVWFPQPAPKDHPLRYAKNPWGGGNAMVPHMSGTSIDAQKRYADGTKAIIESYLSGKHDYRPEDLIVKDGDYVTKAYGQRNKA